MWFHSLFASMKPGLSRSRRPQPRPARRGTRLFVEQLEDRALPSSYTAGSVSDLIADINAANAAGGTNTITLTAPTTSPYALTRMNNGTLGQNGLPVIAAKDILTILGNGDTIKGKGVAAPSNAFRLIEVAGGASLTLVNLTLTGGYMQDSYGGIGGGAICNLGTLVLNGVTVTGNEITGIAGVTTPWSIPAKSAVGGGIWSSGSLTLENGTLLQANEAVGAYGAANFGQTPSNAMGGAVYVFGGTVNISNSTITHNVAVGNFMDTSSMNSYGGALYVAGGQVTLTATTVNSNGATGIYGGSGFGGGVYVAGGTVTLTGDTVESNTAAAVGGSLAFGGGVYVAGGTVTLTGDTVESNTAGGSKSAGGGLFIAKGATVYVDAITLANVIDNTAAIDPNIDGTYILL